MASSKTVKGLGALIKKIKGMGPHIAKRYSNNVKRAGLLLLRHSNELVPIDTGVLRASGYTRAEGTGFDTVVYVGYTTNYALWVHEDLEAAHGAAFNAKYADAIEKGNKQPWNGKPFHKRGEGQQARFLATPFINNRDQYFEILTSNLFPK